MAHSYYNYAGLISPDSKVTLTQLAEKLKSYYQGKSQVLVTESSEGIVVKINDYHFRIYLNDSDYVKIESGEMANYITEDHDGKAIDKTKIEKCERRFEMVGEEDFDMDYFNDSLYITSCIEEMSGVTVVSLG